MKKFLFIAISFFFFACNNEHSTGKFIVTGDIKNADDQKVFLEEIRFSGEPPVIIDTGDLQKGKTTLSGIAPEEGLYRIRLTDGPGFIFINDIDNIAFNADASDVSFKTQTFNSPANASLKNFITTLDSLQGKLRAASDGITALRGIKAKDSVMRAAQESLSEIQNGYNNYILHYIDTAASPVTALFALGYTQQIPADTVSAAVARLSKRFLNHHGLNDLVAKYNQAMAKKSTPSSEMVMAPDFTMPDVNGKPVSLSSFRGKYVLVDFWASWCGPCREENPNVVAAYNKFKDKNFTILGVSLDRDKQAWLQAIKEDGLVWNHISDLKFWNSAAVPLYNIEGIPYNVLLDPQGKIIAKELRGPDLESTLSQVLK